MSRVGHLMMWFLALAAIWITAFSLPRISPRHVNTWGYVERARSIMPEANFDSCIQDFHNAQLHVGCHYWTYGHPGAPPVNGTCPQRAGNENPDDISGLEKKYRISWFTSCLARVLVENGYQIPVYVIETIDNSEKSVRRYNRVRRHIKHAGFKYVRYITDPVANDLPNIDKHFDRIWNFHQGGAGTDERFVMCIWLLRRMYGMSWTLTSDKCNIHGTDGLSDKDRSTMLKNHYIHEFVMNCTDGKAVPAVALHEEKQVEYQRKWQNEFIYNDSLPIEKQQFPDIYKSKLDLNRKAQTTTGSHQYGCENVVSPANRPDMQYILILEDDTFLAENALELISETLIIPGGTNDDPYDVYFYDDTYCRDEYIPPDSFLYPLLEIKEEPTAKTAPAILLSRYALETLDHSAYWMPARRPIDHEYNAVFLLLNMTVARTFPPIIGHGSQTDLEAEEAANMVEKKIPLDTAYDSEDVDWATVGEGANVANGATCFGAFHDIYTGKTRTTTFLSPDALGRPVFPQH